MLQMVHLKIDYDGNVINLMENISSIEEITQEIRNKFPDSKSYPIKYMYKNKPIKQFSQIVQFSQKQSLSVIKIIAEKGFKITQESIVMESQIEDKNNLNGFKKNPLFSKEQSLYSDFDLNISIIPKITDSLSDDKLIKYVSMKKSQKENTIEHQKSNKQIQQHYKLCNSKIVQQNQENNQNKIIQKHQQQNIIPKSCKKSQSQKNIPFQNPQFNNQHQKYPCFQCQVLQPQKFCQICKGKKYIKEGHPFLNIIDTIICKKLDQIQIKD